MPSGEPASKKRWYSGERWAIAMVIAGVAIIALVIAFRGEHGAWLLWFAIPMLMISLGYMFAVRAIPIFLSYGEEIDRAEQLKEESRRR